MKPKEAQKLLPGQTTSDTTIFRICWQRRSKQASASIHSESGSSRSSCHQEAAVISLATGLSCLICWTQCMASLIAKRTVALSCSNKAQPSKIFCDRTTKRLALPFFPLFSYLFFPKFAPMGSPCLITGMGWMSPTQTKIYGNTKHVE